MLIATDPLSLVFIGSFLFGLLFLLVTAFSGSLGHATGHGALHHGHIGDTTHVAHGPHLHAGGTHTGHRAISQGQRAPARGTPQGNHLAFLNFLNPTAIVLFLLGFGFFGYVFHNTTSLALPLALLLASGGGFIIAALLLMFLDRLLGDSEGSTVQDVSDRTGLLGKVSITIPENGLGEVIYISPGGMRKSIPARSTDGRRLERDQEIVIITYQRGVAEVDTWDHFINHEEPEVAQTPDTDEMATLRALLEESNRFDAQYAVRNDIPKE